MVGLASVIVIPAAALVPQADALKDANMTPWLAWVVAVLLVIVEIFAVTLIYSAIVLPCYMDRVFEQVLKDNGYEGLVENDKQHSKCNRVCTACCKVSVCLRFGLMLLTLPLNLIPIIGTMVYIWLNGTIVAWEYHLYYFELKGIPYEEQKAIIQKRQVAYSTFGAQALFLEMIPAVGILFLFTNTVGAALFAVEIEKSMIRSNPTQRLMDGSMNSSSSHNGGYNVV